MNIHSVTSAANVPVQASQARATKARPTPAETPVNHTPATIETAAAAPIESSDAASAAIQNLTKNFSAQPKVALLAQATEFSDNALRLLQ